MKVPYRITLERQPGKPLEFDLRLDIDEVRAMYELSQCGRRTDGSRVMTIRLVSITGGAA